MFKSFIILLFLLLGSMVHGQVISIEANDATASENGGDPGQFRVYTGLVLITAPIDVTYSVSGSAVGGIDYTTLTGTVTLPGGIIGSQAYIDVVGIIDDMDIEGDETVIITLTEVSLGTISPSGNTATVTINDNDASVEFSTAASSDVENTGGNLPGLIVKGSVTVPTSITVADAGTGNATAGTDYSFTSPLVISIPVGEYDGATITPIPNLSVTPDSQVEPDETINLTLSGPNPSTSLFLGTQQITSYTILNDDTATVTISDISGVEDGGPIMVTATVDNPVQGGFTVQASTGDGTATLADNDYTAVAEVLTFSGTAGETQTFSVVPTADTKVESDETIMITLSNLAGTSLAVDISGTGTVTITNDDTCAGGTTAPELVGSVPTDFCDAVDQDLNEYTQSVPPTGTTLIWSTNSDPSITADHLDTSTVNSAGTYYGFFYDTANNCGSPALTVVLTVNAVPSVVSTTPGSNCGPGTVTLEATGTSGSVLNWYDSSTEGTLLGTGTSFTTPNITTTTTFYVEATVGSCTSERTPVLATIQAAPSITATTPDSLCGSGTLILRATGSTGSTLNWYANATGGTTLGTGTSFTTPNLTATRSYYVEATANGCSSGRTEVVATVNALPTVVNTTPEAICGPGIVTLQATGSPGSTLNWYAAATGGSLLDTGTNFTRSINTTTTYYVEAVANTCISASRTPVIATVNLKPFAGSDVNVNACNTTSTGETTTLDLDNQLTGADPGGTWAITTDPSGGLAIGPGNVINFAGLPVNSVYVFTYTTNNAVAPCANDTATVTVTVSDCTCPAGNTAPVLDTSVPTAFCDVIEQDLNEYSNSVPPAGTTLTWSTNSDPTVVNAHINSNVDAPATYYGFFYDATNNCGSPVLQVNLTINTSPVVLTTEPGSRCGTGTVTLAATGIAGSVLNWYDSETGGTFLGTGTSFVTPSIATTTTFYVEAVANSCFSERTAVVATVYEQPDPGIANNTTACNVAGGFTTVDLNSRLTGADPGTWAITTVPSGATVAIGPNGIVDFVGQPDGDYIFTYTTNTAQAPCTDVSTTLTVSVSPADCVPDDIDLELIKEVDKNSIDVGSRVAFTLTLTNLSDIQASKIIVTDSLGISFGFAYVSSNASKGTYNDISGEWTVDTLDPQEMATLEIIASVPIEGTFTNKASIMDFFPNDGNPANNESSVEVEVLPTVCLRIFNQISPNGDGINDELIINCIRNYKNNKLEIFDRYGNKVFSKTDYDNTWSGTGKNGDLPKGTYFYSLDLGDGSAVRTGWIQIIR